MPAGTGPSVRAEAYAALSECFKEPTPAFAADVVSGLLAEVVAAALADTGLTVDLADLREDGSASAVLARLGEAYHALFSVPSRRFVLPVESAFKEWAGGEGLAGVMGLILGPPALDMAERYRHRGLEVPREMKDTPDHLALLLEYGGLLCAEDAVAERREFVASHLDRWVEAFVEQVETVADHPFYRAAARTLGAFVEAERRALGLGDGG